MARSRSHLGSSKTLRDARMQLGQLLGSFSDRAQFAFQLFCFSFCCGHVLHSSEAFYHFFSLCVTVVSLFEKVRQQPADAPSTESWRCKSSLRCCLVDLHNPCLGADI